MNMYPFSPAYGSNQSVTAGDPAVTIAINAQNKNVRIINTGSAIAYVQTSPASDIRIASATDFPIPPNDIATITKDETHDRLSYFCATSTTLQIMTGEGW